MAIFGSAIVCAAPIFIPNAAIAGVQSIGYSVTRIEGPYYFLVQIGILVPLLASLLVMTFFYCTLKETLAKKRTLLLIIACSPFILSVFTIVGLMAVGVKINAVAIISLSICVTLWVLIYTERKEKLYRFMSFIPYTQENRALTHFSEFLANPSKGLNEAKEALERNMIREALSLCDGNKLHAASMLGVSRQTLQRRLKAIDEKL